MLHHTISAAHYHSTRELLRPTHDKTSAPRGEVADLQARLERQQLLVQTLLMILLEKKVIHDDEYKEWLDYVDGLDGVKDGKLREDRRPVDCPNCQRKNPPRANHCQYCGTRLDSDYLMHRPEQA